MKTACYKTALATEDFGAGRENVTGVWVVCNSIGSPEAIDDEGG